MRTTVLVFVAGLVLGAGLGVLCAGRGGAGMGLPKVPRPDVSAEGATLIADRLDRLAAALEAGALPIAAESAAAAPTAAPAAALAAAAGVEPGAIPAESGRLEARIAALEREIGELSGRARAPAVEQVADGQPRTTRWAELRAVLDVMGGNDQSRQTATRQQLALRTPEQLLEILGMPTDVGTNQAGRLVWAYHDPQTTRGIEITFVDGLSML